jgi:hypothetical protein
MLVYVRGKLIEMFNKNQDLTKRWLVETVAGDQPDVPLVVVKAIETAKSKGMKVIGLTGKDGGLMKELCDVEIRAPFSTFADRAQEIHIKVIHSLIDFIERNLTM